MSLNRYLKSHTLQFHSVYQSDTVFLIILCKDNASERNGSLLANCRAQLILCKDNASERNGSLLANCRAQLILCKVTENVSLGVHTHSLPVYTYYCFLPERPAVAPMATCAVQSRPLCRSAWPPCRGSCRRFSGRCGLWLRRSPPRAGCPLWCGRRASRMSA